MHRHRNCGCGHGGCGRGRCGHGCRCHSSRTQPIVCPPMYRFHDTFTQREVPFVHPIVNVNRRNVVNVPRHYFTETDTMVPGRNIFADSYGPGFGGPGSFPGGRY